MWRWDDRVSVSLFLNPAWVSFTRWLSPAINSYCRSCQPPTCQHTSIKVAFQHQISGKLWRQLMWRCVISRDYQCDGLFLLENKALSPPISLCHLWFADLLMHLYILCIPSVEPAPPNIRPNLLIHYGQANAMVRKISSAPQLRRQQLMREEHDIFT